MSRRSGQSHAVSDQRADAHHSDHRCDKNHVGDTLDMMHSGKAARPQRPIGKKTRDQKQERVEREKVVGSVSALPSVITTRIRSITVRQTPTIAEETVKM